MKHKRGSNPMLIGSDWLQKRLCDNLGFALTSVMAFGDSENDLEMLRVAGTGVCMAQGTDSAKRAARRVSQWTNHEDGVARELNQLLDALEAVE
jgi:hydroxymethylpyrimidine pyrophosphatase-like HAD family hydrolase